LRQLAHRAPTVPAQNIAGEKFATAEFRIGTIQRRPEVKSFDQLMDVLIEQLQLIAQFSRDHSQTKYF
jgi:hypothetical protein